MLRIYEKQRWFYVSFFFFIFGFCANALAKGECSIALARKYGDEHDFLAACREGNVDAVKYFLDLEGFNVNNQFISGLNGGPVHSLFPAAQNGHAKVVQVLVNAGADLNKT
ncbi:ankyrin repeat domain-containing protein, partial [Sansalvadorimonas verongulae]|uniref:ankyrin repeat domain-containing protein n=1 Tax=Sansalvadorimonas verongulae TaxID=2172824 RepID=UPI0018AD2693